MKTLQNVLKDRSPGPVEEIESELATCWDQLSGSDAGGMKSDKLDRIKNVNWQPPILSFQIERHGAMVVGGSSRAEIQLWEVDIEAGAAFITGSSYRQVKPRAPSLNTQALAKDVSKLIREKRRTSKLKWMNDTKVKLNMEEIIPSVGVPKQTLAGRRKRFRKALAEALKNCPIVVR